MVSEAVGRGIVDVLKKLAYVIGDVIEEKGSEMLDLPPPKSNSTGDISQSSTNDTPATPRESRKQESAKGKAEPVQESDKQLY